MSNLNQLFTNTTPATPKAIRLIDGKVTVYKRPQSAQWQCRFKLANNKWHSASIPTRLAESITGHSSGGSEFNTYGTVGYTLEQKRDVILKVLV